MTFPSHPTRRVSWGRASFTTSQVHGNPPQLTARQGTLCFISLFKGRQSFQGWVKGQWIWRDHSLRVHELLTLQLPMECLQSGGETWERLKVPRGIENYRVQLSLAIQLKREIRGRLGVFQDKLNKIKWCLNLIRMWKHSRCHLRLRLEISILYYFFYCGPCIPLNNYRLTFCIGCT